MVRTKWTLSCVLALLVVAAACGAGGPSETPPATPAENDPAFAVGGLRSWYLVGDPVTPGNDELRIEVSAPSKVDVVDLWVGDAPGVRLERAGDRFEGSVDVADLAPGEYEVLLAEGGASTGFFRATFTRSHPLYVVVTNDWDAADHSDLALSLQEELHARHPAMVMTHFVGPYTFTDPDIDPERVEYLTEWLLEMRDEHGDEIGLHIHPYCNFVEHAGLPCRSEPSTVYEEGDATGYTVACFAYTDEEFTQLLLAADALFEQHGLGKPTSFRAGGWTADLSTMRALAAAGYVADTSANNWSRMEEWEGVANGVLYEWNMTHWHSIDDTSQPYYPSEDDVLSDAEPTIPVLQIPNNGILVDYVSDGEMIEIFHANWPGGALERPTAFAIGYHPTNFGQLYFHRMDQIFAHLGRYLAEDDAGPVVYGLMSDMPLVWPRP